MSIDPFTFLAQIVNFAILVWLLNKVLYGPILSAIQQREQGFLDRESQLAGLEEACEELKDRLEGEEKALEEKRESLLREAVSEARSVKEKELEKARKDVKNLEQRWRDGLEEQKEVFFGELRRKTADSVLMIARRVLRDLSGEAHLQNLAVERFLRSCEGLELEGSVLVRSAFELDEKQKERVRAQFEEPLFEVEPDLILGLELVHQGQRVGWSARAHLEAMQTELEPLLREASA